MPRKTEFCEDCRAILGHEKQEWNQRCNEACEKQVLKQVNAAYEQAIKIASECPLSEDDPAQWIIRKIKSLQILL